jgi:hypothetical protein
MGREPAGRMEAVLVCQEVMDAGLGSAHGQGGAQVEAVADVVRHRLGGGLAHAGSFVRWGWLSRLGRGVQSRGGEPSCLGCDLGSGSMSR